MMMAPTTIKAMRTATMSASGPLADIPSVPRVLIQCGGA
jgi:hypothetical protein